MQPASITAPKVAEAAALPQPREGDLLTREDYEAYIEENAPKYGVSINKIKAIVSCETAETWSPTIQSGYVLNGEREKSYGLAQINLPSHPSISYKEATDPKFSLNYLIKHIANHSDHWSCDK